ncbi:DUF2079 domain-containing protein [Kocuria sp.]|uniref:DUF2079 domain-containing protein n=1 Tax=Kocuria sp. TaxID=1871328 RepID=UPI0026DA7F50|nr:DUF2079 domain-containing protein [Kocuria sp.]MDO4918383.1 DUF2079 domain-containing protein [Kocuria sp.]
MATLLYCALSWSQWLRWDVPSWDNAIFTQLLSSYAAGDGPTVDLKGHGFNLLGDHFHPLLVVLAPVYRIFPSALTPMLAQDVLFGISAALVTRGALRVLHLAPAAALGVAYALSFGLQQAVAVQFHEIALAVPLLAAGLCALRERRWVAAALWSAPVALVKEDLGITVAAIGALMLAHAARPALSRWLPAARRRWVALGVQPSPSRGAAPPGAAGRRPPWEVARAAEPDRAASSAKAPPSQDGRAGGWTAEEGRSDGWTTGRRRSLVCGLALVVWGVAATVLAVTVVLPALNPAGTFAYADKLDVTGLLRDPASAVILQVVPPQKLVTWLMLLLAGAVVAVRSPLALVAVPTLAWRMLSPNEGYWGPGWHYSAVLMPVVFVALVDAVARLRADAARVFRHEERGQRPRRNVAVRESTVLWVLSTAAPWVALTVALAVGTQQPLAQLGGAAAWQPDPRAQAKTAAVAEIPRDASVGTDLSLMNRLVSRTRVHWIGNGGDPAPQYVVVDREDGTWGGAPPQDVAGYAQQVYGEQYAVVSDEQNIVVARVRPVAERPVR